MRVLVTGGRDYKDRGVVETVLSDLHAKMGFTYLIHGNARGADKLAHTWALAHGVQPVAMDALWDAEGDRAGSRRNRRMLEFSNPDACIAFPGGRGTSNMMILARSAGVKLIDVEDLLAVDTRHLQ